MRVLEESSKAVEAGTHLDMEELGLPVKGAAGLLVVFWKQQ